MTTNYTPDEIRAFKNLFESEGWSILLRDMQAHVDLFNANGLDCPSWEAVQYNKGCRDTLRTLLNYDRFIELVEAQVDDDADPV